MNFLIDEYNKNIIRNFTDIEYNRLIKNLNRIYERDGSKFDINNTIQKRKIIVYCKDCNKERFCRLSDYFKSKTEYCSSCCRKGHRNNSKRIDVQNKIKKSWESRTHEYATDEWLQNNRLIKITKFNKKELNKLKTNYLYLYENDFSNLKLSNSVRTRIIYRKCKNCGIFTKTSPKVLFRTKHIKLCSKCARIKSNWISKLFNIGGIKKTKPEIKLHEYLNELNLNFNYTGLGGFWVNSKNPDFVDIDNKLIIECFGNYWHSKEQTGLDENIHEFQRKQLFEKSGYKTLILWENEILNSEVKVKNKILKFYNINKKEII